MSDFFTELAAHFASEFSLERELGGGGMSRVFLAQDNKLQRRVVIKVLPPAGSETISVDRFKREIMLSVALQHPNIVPVHSAGDVFGLPYFVMPYIDGESVRARMRRGPLSVPETVRLLRDVARALVFAHGRGIVHRDIKPDNVLLSAGTAVVTDFGVAKAISASRYGSAETQAPTITGVGMSPGTPAYMAPEQAAADPRTDHRADIYSLGILAYEVLAGTPPFHGRTPQALLAAQLSEQPPPLNLRRYDVPKALSVLIDACLEKEPARRPQTAQLLLRALEDADVISGEFDAPIEVKRRWARARIRNAMLGAVAAAAVAAVFYRFRYDSAPPVRATPMPMPTINRSITMLPLEPIGSDARAKNVAEGIASELTTSIATVGGIRILSAASVNLPRDGAGATRDTIIHAATPDLLLEGSVQRERSILRVTIRIMRATRDSVLWGQTFDGSTDSTLALQSRIVRAVTAGIATIVH